MCTMWQVRRYVYHDVVRLGDLEKLIECSYIQVLCKIEQKLYFVGGGGGGEMYDIDYAGWQRNNNCKCENYN